MADDMADDTPPLQYVTYTIANLPTRSVTIYPGQALVVREIKEIDIKPGRTQITIPNLTMHAHEASIKVSGQNLPLGAVVTEMTVDLVRNRYADDSGSKSDSESDSDSESESELKPDELKEEISQLKRIESNIEDLEAMKASIEAKKNLYEKMVETQCTHNSNVKPDFAAYVGMRNECFGQMKGLRENIEELERQRNTTRKRVARLEREFERKQRGLRKKKRQRRLERQDRSIEKRAQGLEAPNRVYRVKITIELGGAAAKMPAITGVSEEGRPERKEKEKAEEDQERPYLRISYITHEAYWNPRYDLRLDTMEKSGTLTYRADFTNRTGESWENAKITLSTSQNTFSGLEDTVPWMSAWHVGLAKANNSTSNTNLPHQDEFASCSTRSSYLRKYAKRLQLPTTEESAAFCEMEEAVSQEDEDMGFGLFDGGNDNASPTSPAYSPASPTPRFRSNSPPPRGKLLVATSTSENHGMTTVYDLPGLRTITSSKLVRRHVITELELPFIEFSHISIPKLRAGVYLKARINNNSTVGLLRGQAGLTLDGSFMGNTYIPLCSPGDHFDISLGIDESIQIHYTKPTMKTGTKGMMMMREQAVSYSRNIKIHSSRTGPVKLLVLDQVPVSDDDRLKIDILQPKGLKKEGDKADVTTDVEPNGGSANVRAKIGKVMLKKDGELRWELNLEDQQDVVLPIEYECRMPYGEVIRKS